MMAIDKNTTFVFGDSIAHGVQNAGGFEGLAIDGIAPSKVLSNIQEYIAAHPPGKLGNLQDQNVILSSGMSNNPTQAEKNTITKQIQTLKNAGAHVILLGVSQEHENWDKLNGTLNDIARENQAYLAPLTQTGKDRVHPQNYQHQLSAIKATVNDPSLSVMESASVQYHSKTQGAADWMRSFTKPKLQDQPNPSTEALPSAINGTSTSAAPAKKNSDGSEGSEDDKDDKGFSFKKLFGGDGILGMIGAFLDLLLGGGIFDAIKSLFGGGGKQASPDNASRDNGAARGNETAPPQEALFAKGERLFHQAESYVDTHAPSLSHLGQEARATARKLGNEMGQGWEHLTGDVKLAYEDIRRHFGASNLELGLIKQESKGKISATSGPGAHGLMQLMPKTGMALAAKKGQTYDPNNVQQNFELGRDYLNDLNKQYHGDTAKVLAAYNAGPGAVNKAVQRHGDDWLSGMPAETRHYVPIVMANARQFEQQERAQNQTARMEYASVDRASAPMAGKAPAAQLHQGLAVGT